MRSKRLPIASANGVAGSSINQHGQAEVILIHYTTKKLTPSRSAACIWRSYLPNIPWPKGAKIAVNLTFDFDAETLWLGRDPTNLDRPGTLSQGTYGAKVGVPKSSSCLPTKGCRPLSLYPAGSSTTEPISSRRS